MSERRAHRDPLLLPTGQLARSCVEPVAETTRSSSSRARPSRFAAGAPASPSWTPTSSRAVSSPASAASSAGRCSRATGIGRGPCPASKRGEVDAGDADRARRGPVEPGHDPDERRLAGAAGAEHDADLALTDVQGQPLEGCDAALGARVDAEDVADSDDRRHSIASTRPGAPSFGKAPRVAAPIRRPARIT